MKVNTGLTKYLTYISFKFKFLLIKGLFYHHVRMSITPQDHNKIYIPNKNFSFFHKTIELLFIGMNYLLFA